MPRLTVIAGPNGSGKSSVTQELEFEGKNNLLDPDAVARRIDPASPRRAAIAAGREVILRTREYLAKLQSFAVETTLSSGGDSPERNTQRVRERASRGAHDVSDSDIQRRYARSLINLPPVLRVADEAVLYDNSRGRARKVLETRAGISPGAAPTNRHG